MLTASSMRYTPSIAVAKVRKFALHTPHKWLVSLKWINLLCYTRRMHFYQSANNSLFRTLSVDVKSHYRSENGKVSFSIYFAKLFFHEFISSEFRFIRRSSTFSTIKSIGIEFEQNWHSCPKNVFAFCIRFERMERNQLRS